MYMNKWYCTVAATLLQICGGLCYTFSLFSPSLKVAFDFTQPELEALGSCLLSGGYFGLIPGFLYDALRHRHKLGPRLIAGLGCGVHFTGYFAVWLAAKGIVPMPFPVLLGFALLGSSAVVFFDSATIVTCMRNFPNERGNSAGMLKSFLGVSASLASTIYVASFQPDGLGFLLFVAFLPVAIGLATVPFMNYVPYVEQHEVEQGQKHMSTGSRFIAAYAVVFLIVIYQLVTALIEQFSSPSQAAEKWIMAGVLLLLSLVLLVPIGSGGLRSRPAHLPDQAPHEGHARGRSAGDELDVERTALLDNGHAPGQSSSVAGRKQEGRAAAQPGQAKAREEELAAAEAEGGMPELTLRQALMKIDFWILWCALLVGMGFGFTMLNNMSQIVESLGGGREGQGIFVLLFTTLNTVGRMVGGYMPERLLHRYGTPRTVFAVVASLMVCVAALATAVSGLRLLLPCAMFGGFVFGWHWSLMPVLTSELFGLTHFASNHSVMHLAPTIGGLLLSALLAGNLYDEAGKAHGDPRGACFGQDCYRRAFLIIAGIAAVQAVASIWLFLRTRPLYRTEFARLQKFEQEAHEADAHD